MQGQDAQRLLLIDTCGEAGGVALSLGSGVVAAKDLEQGGASVAIVSTVRTLLAGAGWQLADLTAVGVVIGPGSFTGVRTGLAAAKGLCEAANLPLAAVSRLEVLANAAGLVEGYAVLDAGRGELYVRSLLPGSAPHEYLVHAEVFEGLFAEGSQIVAGDSRSAERLAGLGAAFRPMKIADALPVVLQAPREDAADVDANYVRLEQDIYARQGQAAR